MYLREKSSHILKNKGMNSSFMRSPSSWPNYLPKTSPPPNIITLGIKALIPELSGITFWISLKWYSFQCKFPLKIQTCYLVLELAWQYQWLNGYNRNSGIKRENTGYGFMTNRILNSSREFPLSPLSLPVFKMNGKVEGHNLKDFFWPNTPWFYALLR